jgi:hypothetical protein
MKAPSGLNPLAGMKKLAQVLHFTYYYLSALSPQMENLRIFFPA